MKKKIAIIVQRYGKAVNGGAEVHARMIAEKLNIKYDITVLTSRALSSFKPEYPAGASEENGIKIIRFDHKEPDRKAVHSFYRKFRGRHLFQKIYRALGKPNWYLKIFPEADPKNIDGNKWLEIQGPAVYELIPYLQNQKDHYSAFIFITYQFYPTAISVQAVGDKSILIPTMHDDTQAHFPVFQKVMAAPKVILFNTLSEQKFSEKNFAIAHVHKRIAAVGIEPVDDNKDPSVLQRFGIKGKYILYVGRIDVSKGCDELIEYFEDYCSRYGNEIQLVLAGKNLMSADEKKSGNILFTGFISERDKLQLMEQAELLVIPSKYESLSLVLLESFACRVPVMVNEKCEVLNDHIKLSNGGWSYTGKENFIKQLKHVTSNNEERLLKAEAAYKYVNENYTWEKVLHVFDEAIALVEEKE